ncbi:MAG: hypothetical protein M1835_001220 [Candelina submexicana]|nr:MAG: hypothetical protein M1835_001220 [Candelina submexicana]
MPPERFVGDGLDYRRPRISQTSQAVIDLTNDPDPPPYASAVRSDARPPARPSRPPRFSDDIIDLESNHERSDGPPHQRTQSSPDVEFLSSRPRALPLPRFHGHLHTTEGANQPLPALRTHQYMTTAGVRPALQGYDETAQGVAPFVRMADRVAERANRRADGFRRQVAADIARNHQNLRLDLARQLQIMPINLDFEAIGFPMQHPQSGPPPPPTYKAPSPPRPGFTRSPGDQDTVVCPNCDRELGTGDEVDERQVFVAKGCGHVYCGYCTKNRKSKKGKKMESAKSAPFSKCVVEGCTTSLSAPKAMIQVFL